MTKTSLFFAALALPLAAQAQLVNDTFSDGDRTNQSLPSSSAWYYTGTNGTFDVSGGQLTYTSGNQSMGAFTYFTATGSPATINVGQSLTVSFNLTYRAVNASANNALQLGVFNSFGSRINSDLPAGTSNSAFNGYRGYKIIVGPSATATTGNNTAGVFERTSNNDHPFASTSYTQLGTSGETNLGGSEFAMTAGAVYSVSLKLERTDANTLLFTTSFTPSAGAAWVASRTDTSGSFNFDTFGILTGTGAFATDVDPTSGVDYSGFNIDNFNVSLSNIPEPSSFAAIAGLGMLGLAATRRRRR